MTAEDPAAMPLEQLREKVGRGLTWLQEHDPKGRFYLWFLAKILPGSPMPAQPEEVRQAYREWHSAYRYWLELDALLERREKKEATT